MRTWLTSDLHLFHTNIIQYCDRPYESVDQMNESIVRTWNETVFTDDRVVVVGDLSAGLGGNKDRLRDIIGSLNGRKTLIRGNHDHQADGWYLEAGFELVTDWIFEDRVLFIHKPATSVNPDTVQIFEMLNPDLVVHGHIHSKDRVIPGHFNVAWDRHFRLIDIQEIRRDNQEGCNLECRE